MPTPPAIAIAPARFVMTACRFSDVMLATTDQPIAALADQQAPPCKAE
jgi:hypothetical protein